MDISLAVLLSDLQDSLKNEHKNIIVKRLWIMILPEKKIMVVYLFPYRPHQLQHHNRNRFSPAG